VGGVGPFFFDYKDNRAEGATGATAAVVGATVPASASDSSTTGQQGGVYLVVVYSLQLVFACFTFHVSLLMGFLMKITTHKKIDPFRLNVHRFDFLPRSPIVKHIHMKNKPNPPLWYYR
jgi:hypothetical protein